MRKEEISLSQAYLLLTMFIIGTTFALSGYSNAQQDTWISIIVAVIFATPMVLVYGNILKKHPTMDLFQILELILGKYIGKIVAILYTFYFLHLGSLCIRNITEYIQVVSFPETPQYFTGLFVTLIAIYFIKCGLEVLARVNKFLFPLLFFITAITIIMGISKSDLSNFLPILYNGWGPVLKGGYLSFAIPFAETVIFLSFLNMVSEKKYGKIYLSGIYLGGILLLSIVIRNILILGFPNLTSSNFPSYYAVTLVDIGTYIRGLELVVSVNIIIAGLIKVAICLLAGSIGICRIFNLSDYKWVSAPLGLFILSLSFVLFESTMHMHEWQEIYQYYALPFQVIFPIIILFIGLFRNKKDLKE